MSRPNLAQWLWYTFGGKLSQRHKEWVLHDVTRHTRWLRQVVRAAVQIAVPAAIVAALRQALTDRYNDEHADEIARYRRSIAEPRAPCDWMIPLTPRVIGL